MNREYKVWNELLIRYDHTKDFCECVNSRFHEMSDVLKQDYAIFLYLRYRSLLNLIDNEEKNKYKNIENEFSISKGFINWLGALEYGKAEPLSYGERHEKKVFIKNMKPVLEGLVLLSNHPFYKSIGAQDWYKDLEEKINKIPMCIGAKNSFKHLAKIFPSLKEESDKNTKIVSLKFAQTIEMNTEKNIKDIFNYQLEIGDTEINKKIVEYIKKYDLYNIYKGPINKIIENYPYLEQDFNEIKNKYEDIDEGNIFGERKSQFNIPFNICALEKMLNISKFEVKNIIEMFIDRKKMTIEGDEIGGDNIYKYIYGKAETSKKGHILEELCIWGFLPKNCELGIADIEECLKKDFKDYFQNLEKYNNSKKIEDYFKSRIESGQQFTQRVKREKMASMMQEDMKDSQIQVKKAHKF